MRIERFPNRLNRRGSHLFDTRVVKYFLVLSTNLISQLNKTVPMDALPVTLIVKAPTGVDQQDQTVKCELSWTIRRLKGHLAEVYPCKPVSSVEVLITRNGHRNQGHWQWRMASN